VRGRLVAVDDRMPVSRKVARLVAAAQKDLVSDPRYADLFSTFATMPRAVEAEELAKVTVRLMRERSGAAVALSTASSFRGALPPGPLDLETLRAALPYDNEIVTAELPAGTARELLSFAAAQQGDSFAWVDGEGRGPTVVVATTDYLARTAAGYRRFFEGVPLTATGLRVRNVVRDHLRNGRIAP
jgi:hypothetical protein